MPQVLIDNPVAAVLVFALLVILGWGGRGFWLNLRKDKRDAASDDTALLKALVHEVAREEIAAISDRAEKDRVYYNGELSIARQRVARLERRVDQLTHLIQEEGIPVPPWEPLDKPLPAERG